MAEAILLAVSKIGTVLLNEAVLAVIDKLSRKVDNVKELPAKIKRIDTELKTMNDLAYHVEDVVDKYSYEALKLKDEGFLNRYIFRGSRHIKVFSKIAEEVVELEEEIRQVKGLRDYWSDTVQPINNEHAEIDRQRCGGCFPERVSDKDLVGIDGNRSKLTEWLATNENESTVITVSGMGGLGKTTLVKNVYDREKTNFPNAHAWVVVSRAYDVVDLLKTLLNKIQHTEESPPPSPLRAGAKPDVYELTEAIKKILQDRKCLIVLDMCGIKKHILR
ncbi:Disease resistance protein RPM1 [Hordeum vulgare]|nr:Disease resistance protein RPM1 [Hordeum vulgare]